MSPRPSSDIPQARRRLLAVAQELWTLPNAAHCAVEIWRIIDLMTRRHSNVPRARAQRPNLNPVMAAEIRALKEARPELLQDDIAAHFGVGQGRVSEALAGHDYSPRGSQK